LLLIIMLNGLGYMLNSFISLNITNKDIAIISSGLSGITVICLIIFFRGQSKNSESQTLHTLVAISLKFLLEMVFALIWFFISKKTYPGSVFTFFVIYLTLTLFIVLVMLKTLKNKSL
jgi:hypothetical protein